jgi:hypothetical protein
MLLKMDVQHIATPLPHKPRHRNIKATRLGWPELWLCGADKEKSVARKSGTFGNIDIRHCIPTRRHIKQVLPVRHESRFRALEATCKSE